MSTTLTATQAATIKAIVNLFETGFVLGDYGQVTVLGGDTGHLTFGRSQTTLGSGNLHALLDRYCSNPGARFGHLLRRVLPQADARDPALDTDTKLHNLLRASADDLVMRDLQDEFFDEVYFEPAAAAAERFGVGTPLGQAVVYDSFVHGSWRRIRDRVQGTPQDRGEEAWIEDYVATRRQWLATHPRADLRATVYRMDALARLIELGAWGLPLPLVVRGVEISTLTLTGSPPGVFDGPQPGTRDLAFLTTQTLLRGLDVRIVQLALSELGSNIRADGIFGRVSSLRVAEHQDALGLPASGVADRAMVLALAREIGLG
ncbi:MAG TPA: peptidoglycan-binding protein [Vicinamibacterales bacterium]|nr:peptidoglycan-binding protein [Vicinamibacterales bacterium]